ncbi:SCP2 sterol-binding domain-containing protein [Intrasporangium sp. YIM S08009]|uniref:SCP2 sterol-binding domain-containing protein n=1 Tax=Intrasporangium zincisolvens TaxID=3080018 RepID=UPI002B05FA5B|nr:SCP2 sterol-binding domain-containing protein [Intrasporangium sp. YIM S08009]
MDFATATPEQLAAVEPAEFIQIVKKMSDKDVTALMVTDNREAILSAIFSRMPELFRADRAGSTTATTHWSITGRPDGGADEWTVRFADGTCTALPGHDGDATLTLAMSPVDFTKVITKSGNPVMMFMTGKIKAKGDLGLAANIANFFDIPKG